MRQDKAQPGHTYRKYQICTTGGTVLADAEINWQRVRMRAAGGKWEDTYSPGLRRDLLAGRIAGAALAILGLCTVAKWPDDIYMVETK